MKTAVITGANKSIGFETARQLAQKGYYVYLGSRDRENGEQAVSSLKAEGLTNIETLPVDVSDPASIDAAASLVRQKTGSLDVLVNNAGISGGFPQNPTTIETATIRNVFDINFFGPINVTRAFMDLLKKADQPRIVNVTSGLASLTLHADPSWMYYDVKGAAYIPSKTALNAYTVMLAYELRNTTFKINVVDPGYTATDFNHHSGTGTVTDAAAIIVKYATLDATGPTGKFFSNDIKDHGESPW